MTFINIVGLLVSSNRVSRLKCPFPSIKYKWSFLLKAQWLAQETPTLCLASPYGLIFHPLKQYNY